MLKCPIILDLVTRIITATTTAAAAAAANIVAHSKFNAITLS